MAQLRLTQHHAGEKGAKREGDTEERGRAKGDADRDRQDAECEQLARACPRHLTQQPGQHTWSDQQRDRDERCHLGQRKAKGHEQALAARCMHIGDHLPPERFGERWQQHQDQDHSQILDDQPADGDTAVDSSDDVAFLQRLQQHHSTGNRQAEAQHHPCPHAPAPRHRHADADAGSDDDLANGAGNHHPPYGHQIGHGEMQAHAEHQQHDTDLGQLSGYGAIGDEAGGEGAYRHPCDKIADQW